MEERSDKGIGVGDLVWCHWDPRDSKSWFPAKILNRYDHEVVRVLPEKVLENTKLEDK